MKKVLLAITLFASFAGLHAQTVTDSVSMGAGYQLDVFYNLTTGSADTVRNNNWHLAFAMRNAQPPFDVLRSATVRINEARNVNVYQSSQGWNNFDTTGWQGWPMLHDVDSTWDLGALNSGFNVQQFNFGWGNYDMTTHDINGTKVYLVKIGTGVTTMYKKLMVKKLVFDTTWIFSYANVDNTDSVGVSINKSAFMGKLFAYHDMINHTTLNREPNHPWDLLFTYYRTQASISGLPPAYYNFTGVKQAPQLNTARVQGIPKPTADTSNATMYVKKTDNIGWDWKLVTAGPPSNPYVLIDSLSYFIRRDADSLAYKLVFTKFTYADATYQQAIVFNKTTYHMPIPPPTGIAGVVNDNSDFTLYPNPASAAINISIPAGMSRPVMNMYDMTGKMVLSTVLGKQENSISLEGLNKGVYFITLDANGSRTSRKLIVE